jgi:hypothetical protein
MKARMKLIPEVSRLPNNGMQRTALRAAGDAERWRIACVPKTRMIAMKETRDTPWC